MTLIHDDDGEDDIAIMFNGGGVPVSCFVADECGGFEASLYNNDAEFDRYRLHLRAAQAAE